MAAQKHTKILLEVSYTSIKNTRLVRVLFSRSHSSVFEINCNYKLMKERNLVKRDQQRNKNVSVGAGMKSTA